MTVKPKRVVSYGLPNILTFTAERGQPALVVGAWKKSLVVRRGGAGSPGWKNYLEIGVADVFESGKTVHLAISVDPKGTTIFVDGQFKGSFPNPYPEPSPAPLGRLLLGNSPTGSNRWRGDILGLALYDRAWTPATGAQDSAAAGPSLGSESDGGLIAGYRFDAMHGNFIPSASGPQYDIVIPTHFAPLRRTVLDPPRGGGILRRSSLLDMALNVLGFIPFGILALLYLSTVTAITPRRRSTMVVLAGFSLSLFIELTQAFLPTRSSSLMDLATNTLGAAVGVLMFFIFSHGKPEPTVPTAAPF